MKKKIIRISSVRLSLQILLKGQLKYMSQYYDVVGISSSGSEQEIIRKNENIEVLTVEMSRKISPIKDLKSLFTLYRILKKEKPHIVHTHTPKAGTVGMIAALLSGVPLKLHTVAGLPLMEAKGLKRLLLNTVEYITYWCADKVYPNSFGLCHFISENKLAKESKLKVIGNGSSNGIDTEHFNINNITGEEIQALKNELGIKNNDFVFIFVGRLVGDKGIYELVKAFSDLQNKTAKLILVGPQEIELDPLQKDTLNEIENNPEIISVGFKKDVRPFLAIANCLVHPSYREGFPNVVMQAGAMQLPCVVTNINGNNEIIIDDENGLIVPVKNHYLLRIAMEKIMIETDLYEKMKNNARAMIVSRFEKEFVWASLHNEYEKLLNDL